MTADVGGGRAIALACALLVLSVASGGRVLAAPRAAGLGPEVVLTEPAGGFVGRLDVVPAHGPAGTPLQVTGDGFPADQEFELVWRTVKGRWKVTPAEYHGREFPPVAYRIATVRSDKSGRIDARFVAPEDYGFMHDVVLQRGNRLLTQTAFNLDITARLAANSGPLGTPITVEVQGIGWRELEGSWVLLYDNKFTGFMSVVTTGGTARFTIPATGHVGLHVVEVMHSDFGSPYRNTQQSPVPDRPQFKLGFTITPGTPVLPPPPAQQAQTEVRRLPPQGDLVATPAFAGVGQPAVVRGTGFEPGKTYQLNWNTVVGNRMTSAGWEEKARVIASGKADAAGRAEFHFDVPDDLGGAHNLWIEAGGTKKKKGALWIAPTALPLDVARGPAGTTFKVHLKGVGWSETANIYTVVYDNTISGYACAFNSQGDIEIVMQATGEPGWHFIDLYPAIYKGKETRPNNYRLPQLTYADDHPGEDLPRFRFAFEVVSAGPLGQ
jgi:hypothetical protein